MVPCGGKAGQLGAREGMAHAPTPTFSNPLSPRVAQLEGPCAPEAIAGEELYMVHPSGP